MARRVRGLATRRRSERAQEVENVLLLARRQKLIEVEFNLRGFRVVALMGLDGAEQIVAASVMQEKDSLS